MSGKNAKNKPDAPPDPTTAPPAPPEAAEPEVAEPIVADDDRIEDDDDLEIIVDPLPLSVLLDGHEIAALASTSMNADDFTVITLPSSPKVQVSEKLQDGSRMLMMQVRLPPGIFRESRVIDPRRGGGNPLDHALGMVPAVRLVVKIDRLSLTTQAEIQRQIEEARGQADAGVTSA